MNTSKSLHLQNFNFAFWQNFTNKKRAAWYGILLSVQIIHWAHLPYSPHVSLAHELALLHAPLLKRFQVVASITYLSQVMFPSMAHISISLANFFGLFKGKICFLGVISVKFCFIKKILPVLQTQNSKKKSWLPRYLPKTQAAHHVMSHQFAIYGKMHAIICNIPFNHMHT